MSKPLYSHLEVLHDNGPTNSGYLLRAKSNSINPSTQVHFTRFGIILSGDLTPGPNNVPVMASFKNRHWFLGELGQGYLCSKFLRAAWHPELVEYDLQGYIDSYTEDSYAQEDAAAYRTVLEQWDCEMSADDLRELMEDVGLTDVWDGFPGYGVLPADSDLLFTIQRDFKRLYQQATPAITTLDEYQTAALRTATPDAPNRLAVSGLGLAGESGEAADLIKKHIGHGHPLDRQHLKKELGDALWYIADLASALNMTLREVAQANVDKLRARYPDGFDPERSLNRESEVAS